MNIKNGNYDPEIFSHPYWFNTAERLKYSAELLYSILADLMTNEERQDEVDLRENQLALFDSYMMLMGFALENLIKGVSIKAYTSNGIVIDEYDQISKKVWKVKNGHDIIQIASLCHFSLNEEEHNLLQRCKTFAVWAGRYHLPKFKSEYDDAFANERLHTKPEDKQIIDNLFKRANDL